MSTVDSKRIGSVREGERPTNKRLVYAFVTLSVFVLAVIAMGLEDGPSGAAVTALLAFAIAATAVGLWGTAMAVRETDQMGSRSDD